MAILIKARQIQKAKGFASNADVKAICEAAGVSRKTGYQWVGKLLPHPDEQEKSFSQELTQIKSEYEKLKERYSRLEFENEGRKLAWEIHGVDELLAAKKNTTRKKRKKKR